MRAVLLGIAVGDYRRAFLERVKSVISGFEVISGDVHFEPSFRSGRELGITFQQNKNSFFIKRRLVWQRKVFLQCLTADACIIEHNPRSLTAWAVGLGRRALGKQTVSWGHVESRAGYKPLIGLIRHFQRRLCGVALFYTNKELMVATDRYGKKPMAFVAPNALYSCSEWKPPPDCSPRDFIFIGRLSEDKKPNIALQAFILAKLPPVCAMHFVGEGPMRPALEKMAQNSDRKVSFHGHVSDRSVLAGLFYNSIAAISPGYVGLSIVQSTYFGCPIIYSEREPHAPEIILAKEGFNSLSVEHCKPDCFAKKMECARLLFKDFHRRVEIAKHSVSMFNVEKMADGFIAAVNYSLGK